MKKVLLFIKKNYLWFIGGMCLLGAIMIVEDIFEQEIMKIDTFAYTFFIETIRSNTLTKFMMFITKIGNATTLIILSLLSFILLKQKKQSLCITINLTLITIINQVLKSIIQRPRPDGYRLISETGYSFPSGHSMASVAFFGFLIYLTYKYTKEKKIRYLIYTFLSILIILIGTSRIYLGVHYASDVVAGSLLSILYLIIYTYIINRFILSKERKNEKISK